jgi:transposase-like protein
MAKYQRKQRSTIEKSETLNMQLELPMAELLAGACDSIEALCGEIGLRIMLAVMRREIDLKTGPWGQQRLYRHGTQKGYVVYAGRKLALERPRMRHPQKGEVPLASYKAFQSEGKLQRAVARRILRNCSMRNYEGALDDCLQGYGIKRSSVSRHFKATTSQELKELLERPVPKDLLALLIDGKYFPKQCIIVALGIDKEGRKHVLGLWEGATENATVVKGLLEDLVARGLDPQHKLLIVMDGGKALRKAVDLVFGSQALVQRCRVHKQRNVVEHLPKEKQGQAIWRLRAAWSKADPKAAEKELHAIVRWLDGISPMAARSLREGLEETLTLQKLGINARLAYCLSSTNMIESCFAHSGSMTRRVKHWRDGRMVLRWAAATLRHAEKSFRRVRGFEHLAQLEDALCESQPILKAA